MSLPGGIRFGRDICGDLAQAERREWWLAFTKADATLLDGDRALPLCSNRWSDGTVDPQGHVHTESFQLYGRLPVWRYALGAIIVEQRIWLEPGANTVYIAWRLEPGIAAKLCIWIYAQGY